MPDSHDDSAAFSRKGTDARDDKVEIRVYLPRHHVNVLDAVAMARSATANARSISRNELIVEVLQDFSDQKFHEYTLIHRLTSGHPNGVENRGKTQERDV